MHQHALKQDSLSSRSCLAWPNGSLPLHSGAQRLRYRNCFEGEWQTTGFMSKPRTPTSDLCPIICFSFTKNERYMIYVSPDFLVDHFCASLVFLPLEQLYITYYRLKLQEKKKCLYQELNLTKLRRPTTECWKWPTRSSGGKPYSRLRRQRLSDRDR